MKWLFYLILSFHLFAVTVKLGLLFLIPRLQNVTQVQSFLFKYKKWDSAANWLLWLTGAAMVFTTSLEYLLQMWLLVSMLLYMLVFWIVKKVVMRGLQQVATSKKVHAHEELKKLRFENLCVIVTVFGLLAAIGTIMMTKPF